MEDPEQKKNYKYCIVPQCENTSVKTPKKIFISLPRNVERNKQWQKAMKRKNMLSVKSTYFVCEDHFNLETDMENYRYFKLMDNVAIKIRSDVVPHIFDCQKTRTAAHGTQSQEVFLRRQHQAVLEEIENQPNTSKKSRNENNNISDEQYHTELIRNQDHLGAKATNKGCHKKIQVNIKRSMLTKQTQCDLHISFERAPSKK
ncbi:uncharacterized protein LOC108917967 [Anoplophora glabripennis]|uniref:uncharacterized protein LOC108917967 n=1 Tax=Anoplophora glabripennis TaxID=217634 RepID=UPI00087398C2|nr:uncharacterized protein LOC108917967 [Anoplophora glabripennis]